MKLKKTGEILTIKNYPKFSTGETKETETEMTADTAIIQDDKVCATCNNMTFLNEDGTINKDIKILECPHNKDKNNV